MIVMANLFDSVCLYASDHYVGMNPMPEFVIKVNESQREIMDAICPQYDRNERIRTLLDPFVENVTGSSTGSISKPTGYYRSLSITAEFNGKKIPVYQAKENELIYADFIPQRKADFARGIAYYKQAGTDITVIPADTVPYTMYYCRKPIDGSLAYSYSALPSGEVALQPSNVVDLEWDDNAYGLILNWVLRKYGLINKDQFLLEIANYGISSDLIQND